MRQGDGEKKKIGVATVPHHLNLRTPRGDRSQISR